MDQVVIGIYQTCRRDGNENKKKENRSLDQARDESFVKIRIFTSLGLPPD